MYAHYEQPDIISGAKNRWIFYPGCMTSEPDSTIYGELAPPGYDHIQDLYESIAQAVTELGEMKRVSKWNSDDETATLEMYGQAAVGPSLRARVLQATHGSIKGGEIHHAARSKQPRAYEEMLATYCDKSKRMQVLEAAIDDRLADTLREHGHLFRGEEWANLVQLFTWRDTPACECCGWEMEDYMEELIAGLNPREAVLHRALMGLGAERGQRLED